VLFSAKVIEYLLWRFSAVYNTLKHAKQRNVVTYFMQVIYTTIALGITISETGPVLRNEGECFGACHARGSARLRC